jgi:mycofactocin precursor
MEEREKEVEESRNDMEDDDIFKTEEVRIEEIAIDGICGVY